MAKSLLLTGYPGIGKTTIIRKVADSLGDRAGGFYTEEISGPGGRQGFQLTTLAGEAVQIAHKDFKPPRYPQEGRYGVDVKALEKVGVKALERAIQRNRIVIADGIDLVQLYSKQLLDVLMGGVLGNAHIVGTLMSKSHPEADAFRFVSKITLWEVERRNRDTMHERVLAWIDKLK